MRLDVKRNITGKANWVYDCNSKSHCDLRQLILTTKMYLINLLNQVPKTLRCTTIFHDDESFHGKSLSTIKKRERCLLVKLFFFSGKSWGLKIFLFFLAINLETITFFALLGHSSNDHCSSRNCSSVTDLPCDDTGKKL